MTKTEQIFQLTAPYDNPFQGKDKKLLFVCSAGLLRSPTGASLYNKKGYNTRSCGSASYALIPLSANLIAWADHIIFVNGENADEAARTFHKTGSEEDLIRKQIVLNIPDNFDYNSPDLQQCFFEQLDAYSI